MPRTTSSIRAGVQAGVALAERVDQPDDEVDRLHFVEGAGRLAPSPGRAEGLIDDGLGLLGHGPAPSGARRRFASHDTPGVEHLCNAFPVLRVTSTEGGAVRQSPTRAATDSRARIRASALRLFAARGVAATSLREVARESGVAPGLVVHHFGGKDGLHANVDDYVVSLLREALETVPLQGRAGDVVAARDEAAARMSRRYPEVIDYLRRAVVTPDPGAEGLTRLLMEETIRQTQTLRDHGIARSRVPVEEQAVAVLVRQLGTLLLQPALGRLWALARAPARLPRVRVGLHPADAARRGHPVRSVTSTRPAP